jgi:hypothetical protein
MKCFLLSMIMFVSSNQLFAAGAAGAAAAGRPRDMMPMEFIAQMKKFRDEGDLNGGLKLIAQEKDNPKIVHILPIWRGQMATLRGKLEAAGALSVVASNPAGASPAAAGPGSAVGERRLILIKRVPNGSDLEMEINSTATLGDLRREIARRTGISSEKQRLILGGKEVQEDDRTRLQHIPEAFSLNRWHLFEKVPASMTP